MSMMQAPAPRWLQVLLEEQFFEGCSLHEHDTKNEKNILCLECCVAVCAHCLAPHHCSHRLIQIRRYVYHDVIRLEDAEKLLNCSSIQSYVNNGAKVVFLKERAQARAFRASGNVCFTCNRCLQPPFSFCSLSCKVRHLLETEGSQLVECSGYQLPSTPDSVLEQPAGAGGLLEWFNHVRKKRSSLTTAPPTASTPLCSSPSSNRRKTCTPHRSPLY